MQFFFTQKLQSLSTTWVNRFSASFLFSHSFFLLILNKEISPWLHQNFLHFNKQNSQNLWKVLYSVKTSGLNKFNPATLLQLSPSFDLYDFHLSKLQFTWKAFFPHLLSSTFMISSHWPCIAQISSTLFLPARNVLNPRLIWWSQHIPLEVTTLWI